MTRQSLSTIALAGAIGASAIGCSGSRPEPSPVPGTDGPHIEFEVTDGLRTLDRVLRQPSLVMTLRGADDQATYEGRLRIGSSPERTLRNIWNGVPRDLSGELLSLSAFGKAVITGYLFSGTDPGKRIPFETTVWMEYSPAHLEAVLLYYDREIVMLSDGAVLRQGEGGEILAEYSPADTYLHIALETAGEDSPIVFAPELALNREGRFSIPFHVSAPGETTVTLAATSGRDTTRIRYRLLCTPPADEPTDNE